MAAPAPARVAASPAMDKALATNTGSNAGRSLLIMSWNIAGWEPTLRYIREHYGSLDRYLDRHGADILCVQEVKVDRSRLSADPKALCAQMDNWDTFWGCNSTSKRGFNGVATFVRKGLSCGGDAAPLGDKALDDEGRCLLTDHGKFVVLNVYVHAGGSDGDGSRLSRKLAFLGALRRKMQAVRVSGKAVILCGDLNIAARGADVPWQQALLRLDFLIGARLVSSVAPSRRRGEQAEGATNAVATMEAAAALEGAEVGESVEQAVGEALGETSMAAAPSGPLDSIAQPRLENDGGEKGDGEGERFGSGRAECAGVGGNDGLGDDDDDDDGDASGKADPCASAWSSPAVSAAERRVLSALGSTAPLVAEKLRRTCGGRRWVPAHQLCAAVSETDKGSGSSFERAVDDAVRSLAHEAGRSNSQRDCVAWLDAITSEDGMVDSFANMRPRAAARFTCWDQYKNMRYSNVGRRIDYILVDKCLFDEFALVGAPLVEAEDHAGALLAATARGRWQPAPLRGGGLQASAPVTKPANLRKRAAFMSSLYSLIEATQTTHDLQFTEPHTGMVYTPPGASDHIAVSLLLRVEVVSPRPLPSRAPDAATKACTFRSQRSLTSFFTKSASSARPSSELSTACKKQKY